MRPRSSKCHNKMTNCLHENASQHDKCVKVNPWTNFEVTGLRRSQVMIIKN